MWLLQPQTDRIMCYHTIRGLINVNLSYDITSCDLPMRACPSGPAPGLVGYRSRAISIGPVQDRFWHVGTRPYGHEKKSNYDKTTLVAFQASLLLGGGTCDSGKLALADLSTRSTSTEGRELPGCRLWRHWWQVVNYSFRCRRWRRDSTLAALCSSVPKSSTDNTLHVKIYDNL